MGNRLRTVGLFALSGFFFGVAANFVYFNALPVLAQLFPQILERTWLLWGLVGAIISVAGCLLYAFLPEK